MPYDDPDPGDPQELVAVSVPAAGDSLREMAATFADEFASRGYGEEQLLNLFRQPFYTAPHHAWTALGEVEVRRVVRESLEFWGRFRVMVEDAPAVAATGVEPLVSIGGRRRDAAGKAEDER